MSELSEELRFTIPRGLAASLALILLGCSTAATITANVLIVGWWHTRQRTLEATNQ